MTEGECKRQRGEGQGDEGRGGEITEQSKQFLTVHSFSVY